MLTMVRILIVQLPIHVIKRTPEQTIHRKSEGDNKSDNVDEWSDDGSERM